MVQCFLMLRKRPTILKRPPTNVTLPFIINPRRIQFPFHGKKLFQSLTIYQSKECSELLLRRRPFVQQTTLADKGRRCQGTLLAKLQNQTNPGLCFSQFLNAPVVTEFASRRTIGFDKIDEVQFSIPIVTMPTVVGIHQVDQFGYAGRTRNHIPSLSIRSLSKGYAV